MSLPQCITCTAPLVHPDNWYKTHLDTNRRCCKNCHKARVTASQKTSPTFSAYQRKWQAKNPKPPRPPSESARIRNREACRRYKERHPDRVAASYGLRRSRKSVKSLGYDKAKIEAVYAFARHLTELTGTLYEVDHVIPLAKGGLHHQDNLVAMVAALNRRKAATIIPGIISHFTPNYK